MLENLFGWPIVDSCPALVFPQGYLSSSDKQNMFFSLSAINFIQYMPILVSRQ
jgi:hypothetical protein